MPNSRKRRGRPQLIFQHEEGTLHYFNASKENDSPYLGHVDPTKPFEDPNRAFQMLCDKELRWGRWDVDKESRLVDVKKDKDAVDMTR